MSSRVKSGLQFPPDATCLKCGHRWDEHNYRHRFESSIDPMDPWVRIAELEQERNRAQERIRAWDEGFDPPALEDDDALGPPDVQELIDAAPRFEGDRDGGRQQITLEDYEAVVSRSAIVAYSRHLAWQQKRINELQRQLCQVRDAAQELVIGAYEMPALFFCQDSHDPTKTHPIAPEKITGLFEQFEAKVERLGDWSFIRDAEKRTFELEIALRLAAGLISTNEEHAHKHPQEVYDWILRGMPKEDSDG